MKSLILMLVVASATACMVEPDRSTAVQASETTDPIDRELIEKAATAWVAEYGPMPDKIARDIWCESDSIGKTCCIELSEKRCCVASDKWGVKVLFCQKKNDDGTWPPT